jgi:HK97 family phage major capsid protein
MYSKILATQKLLEDSSINIENWIATKTGERFGRLEGAAFITGDGIGKPRGILTYANGTAWGQIEQVNMGAAAALTADGFIDVKYRLREYYIERASAWLMNRTTVAAAMKLKDGAGDYIWKPSLIASDPISSILGIPVRMSTTMPAVAANALSVALGDWRSAYMIVDRLGITVQRDPYTSKPFVEFYIRKRCGADVLNFDALKIGIIHV